MIIQRRCFGITRWRFCNRKGDWLLFCHDHNRQWIPFLLSLLAIAGSICSIWALWPKPDSFTLAECTFDVKFEIPVEGLKTFSQSMPLESGTVTVIMNLSQGDKLDQNARIRLAGKWQGTSGLSPILAEDSLLFILSERLFVMLNKKPMMEYVSRSLRTLTVGEQYQLQLTAFPGFAIPLIPKGLFIRTHEGLIYSVSNFTGPSNGWYFATFTPDELRN